MTCSSCHKKGHYQAVCRRAKHHKHLPRKTVQELSEEDFYDSFEDEDEFFLVHIFHLAEDNCWTAEILTNGKPHTFKLDTGASVSVVDELWAQSHVVKRSNKQLKGPGNTKLTILGTVQAKLCYKTNTVQETPYVLKGQPVPFSAGQPV